MKNETNIINTNTSVLNTHGISALPDFDATLKAADLDWEVRDEAVGGMDSGIEFPDVKMLTRSDNQTPLGIVGKDYAASDPRAFLHTQFEFAEFIGGSVHRAGFIAPASKAFAFIKVAEFDVTKVGDPCAAFIYSTDGWDGGTPRQSRLYIERLICSNGQKSKKIVASLWSAHTKNSEETYSKKWKKFLNELTTSVAAIRSDYVTLADTKMSAAQFEEFSLKLMPGESTLSTNRRGQLAELFSTGVGNAGATRWDAYNAVTEFVTHHRSYRETRNVSAETNRFLGVMETDTLNDKALAMLVS